MAEKIVDKYWINPDGECIRCWPEHQLWAWDNLGPKITRKMKSKAEAEDYLKNRGWLRVQIYADEGLGIEGQREYINRNAQNIMEVLPNPRRVYVQPWPITGQGDYFGAEDLDRLGWDALATRRKKRLLFAAMLKQIADKAEPEKRETFRDRWAKRKRGAV
jgi:hypothetical protein